MTERTNEELADVLDRIHVPVSHKAGNALKEAARRLREMDGERIEGCQIGSAFTRGDDYAFSVTVKLPPGGSLHKMLLQRCTLVLHPPEPTGQKRTNDPVSSEEVEK